MKICNQKLNKLLRSDKMENFYAAVLKVGLMFIGRPAAEEGRIVLSKERFLKIFMVFF